MTKAKDLLEMWNAGYVIREICNGKYFWECGCGNTALETGDSCDCLIEPDDYTSSTGVEL